MSFLPINEENQQAPTGQTTNAPQGTPPPQAGGSAGAGSTGPKGSATGSPTQFGSSASKLGDYLSANAPQIQGQANTLANSLNTQYGQVQGDISNAANQFGQQVQSGYAAPNQSVVNQAVSNPTQFASNPENVKAFQAQYNNQYTGPQNFESTTPYSNIQSEVGNAVQQANLLGSQAGLQSYLQGTGKNPTKASSTLDALLLRGNPEAQQQIQTAAGQFKGLTDQFGNAVTGANQSVQAAQKTAQDAQAQARGTFDPYVQQFGKQINQGAQTAEQQRQAYNQAQQANYNKLTPIQQYLQAFQGNSGYTLPTNPLTPYLNQTPITNPITTQNYATPEQYQQAAAIQQLLGGNAQLPINADTANLAGTAPQVGQFNQANPVDLISQIMGEIKGQPIDYNTYGTLLQNLQSYDPTNIKQTYLNIPGVLQQTPADARWNYLPNVLPEDLAYMQTI